MEGEKKGRREKKEGEKERRGNERMEGVDRGWIKEGNFFKGGEFSIRSVGFTRDREWVGSTRATTASLLNNSKVREFVGLGVNSGSSFPKIELNFKLISLRGSSGGGIRLLGTDRPTFRSLLAGKSSRRREERLIKLMQKYTSQGTEGKY